MRTVTLVKEHIHSGEKHPPGKSLSVDDITAEWLLKHEVASETKTPSSAPEFNTQAEPMPASSVDTETAAPTSPAPHKPRK